MSEHRGVSAAEKYAELEKAGASRPRCSCHGEEMLWNRHADRRTGGRWRCVVQHSALHRRWREANPEWNSERSRRWREANPEKVAAHNASRMSAGDMYLGTCRFNQTEVEAMLSGTSE